MSCPVFLGAFTVPLLLHLSLLFAAFVVHINEILAHSNKLAWESSAQ